MSLKRLGKEAMLAAGLMMASGEFITEAEASEPAKTITLKKENKPETEAHRSQKVENFKIETAKILASMYPENEAEAEKQITEHLDSILNDAQGKTEQEQLSAIDGYAKNWLKAEQKVGGGKTEKHTKKDLNTEHSEAFEHMDDVKQKLKTFFDSKTSDAEAMNILMGMVTEGSTLEYNTLEFKRDVGSNDIYLNGVKVDTSNRKDLIEQYGK